MPVCFYIYFCQQLDKSSVSFAANFGLRTDANLTGSEYSWLSSIIYFAQLAFVSLLLYNANALLISTATIIDLRFGTIPGEPMDHVLFLRMVYLVYDLCRL
jgi:hypothetical protein